MLNAEYFLTYRSTEDLREPMNVRIIWCRKKGHQLLPSTEWFEFDCLHISFPTTIPHGKINYSIYVNRDNIYIIRYKNIVYKFKHVSFRAEKVRFFVTVIQSSEKKTTGHNDVPKWQKIPFSMGFFQYFWKQDTLCKTNCK